jgi:hypothetical protein
VPLSWLTLPSNPNLLTRSDYNVLVYKQGSRVSNFSYNASRLPRVC